MFDDFEHFPVDGRVFLRGEIRIRFTATVLLKTVKDAMEL